MRCVRPTVLLAFAAALPFASCTSLVWPPERVEQPARAFVLREALHLGLLLPDPPEAPVRWVEYGYGDWAWFALGHEQWYRAIPTVLWPTQATLCRREWKAESVDELLRRVAARGCEVDELVVEQGKVLALRERLDARFATPEIVRRPELAMEFVPEDGSYWLFSTCADVAADWCEELGCEVGWVLVRGGLRVPVPAEPVDCGGGTRVNSR